MATLRFNFAYREAGRKLPDRPLAAIAAWWTSMDAAAEGMPAAGLVYLGYPLHPPGKPDKLRDERLYSLDLPMIFLQEPAPPRHPGAA